MPPLTKITQVHRPLFPHHVTHVIHKLVRDVVCQRGVVVEQVATQVADGVLLVAVELLLRNPVIELELGLELESMLLRDPVGVRVMLLRDPVIEC